MLINAANYFIHRDHDQLKRDLEHTVLKHNRQVNDLIVGICPTEFNDVLAQYTEREVDTIDDVINSALDRPRGTVKLTEVTNATYTPTSLILQGPEMIKTKVLSAVPLYRNLVMDLGTLNRAEVKADQVIDVSAGAILKGERGLAEDIVSPNFVNLSEHSIDLEIVQTCIDRSCEWLRDSGILPPPEVRVASVESKAGRLHVKYHE